MGSRWWQGERPTTIRARVQLLVVACVVPAWLLAFAISYVSYQRERNAIVITTVQAARSLTQSVEREFSTSIAVLQTLGTSTHIDEGDMRSFHASASETLRYSSGEVILLLDTELRVLMSSQTRFGTPLPTLKHDRFPQVMVTRQPAVSEFFIGQVSREPQVAVAVPVIRNARVIGRLEMVLSPQRFTQLLARQQMDPDWTVAVLDSHGVIVARNRKAESFVGQPATPAMLQALKDSPEGSSRGKTKDGIDVIACFSRSSAYGWSVAIGVPEAALNARLERTLVAYIAGTAAMLTLGLLLASVIGRRISEPIQALVAPALAIGMGESASIAPSPVREVAELGQALQQALALLREREQARQQAVASLRDSQSRLRMVLDASQIGDWDLDLRTDELHHSLRHDQCFGYSGPVPDWTVATFFDHVHPDDRERVNRNMQAVLRDGKSWQQDCRVVWPDGSVHWLSTHGTCLSENSVPYFMMGIVIDISDRKQSEELRLNSVRLELENQQMQEANRLKSEFLANMSHELRTPLNAVIGFADILRSSSAPLPAIKQQEFLGHIASSGRHLLQLINDVLDLSKVESGKLDFFPEWVDLPRLMGEVTGVLQAELALKGITLITELEPGLTDLLLDPARLKQMLYNFLSNAIKFTDPGGQVVLRAFAQGPSHVRIEVEDTGIGVAEADQHKLFHQYQQIHSGYAKPHQGTGLGLALTRRLAELQGGSVGVRSTLGVGSVFHLVLPRRSGRHGIEP